MTHDAKIPVTVLTGFLGSGKTTFLNRVLGGAGQAADNAKVAVVINELGAVALDHKLVKYVGGSVAVLVSGCVCCSVRGELVDTLRDLFMAALQRKIPAFSRVIIETTGIADPAPVMYTLRYDAFLRERYAYAGCLCMVDGEHGHRQLRQPEAVRQAALADLLILSKADLCTARRLAHLEHELRRINPDAPVCSSLALPGLEELFGAAFQGMSRTGRPAPLSLSAMTDKLAPAMPRSQGLQHGGVALATLQWETAVARSVFVRAMERFQEQVGQRLLRVKGLVRFAGGPDHYIVHGVHEQLYPLQVWSGPESGEEASAGSVLNFIARDVPADQLQRAAYEHFPFAAGGAPHGGVSTDTK